MNASTSATLSAPASASSSATAGASKGTPEGAPEGAPEGTPEGESAGTALHAPVNDRATFNLDQFLRLIDESSNLIEEVMLTSTQAMTSVGGDFARLTLSAQAERRQQRHAAQFLPRLSAAVLAEFNTVAEHLYAMARQAGVPSSRVNDRLSGSRERIAALIDEINRIHAPAAMEPETDHLVARIVRTLQCHDLWSQRLAQVSRENLPQLLACVRRSGESAPCATDTVVAVTLAPGANEACDVTAPGTATLF